MENTDIQQHPILRLQYMVDDYENLVDTEKDKEGENDDCNRHSESTK